MRLGELALAIEQAGREHRLERVPEMLTQLESEAQLVTRALQDLLA